MIVERLAQVEDANLIQAIRILKHMVEGDDENWHIYSWRSEAKEILMRGMRAGKNERALCEQIVDRLGRLGFIEFGEVLVRGNSDA